MVNVSVIMPCKNEEDDISNTLHHLEAQTVKPNEVVIIDDASTDNTPKILNEFAKKNAWIINRKEKNDDNLTSIVNSLILASKLLKNDFDYLLILDADTLLESTYIEKILQKFQTNLMLGISGGRLKSTDEYKMVSFLKQPHNLYGSNRIYSKKCWYDINRGKIMRAVTITWDTEHSDLAVAKGYVVKRFDDVLSISIRPTSHRLSSIQRGIAFFQLGYGLAITLAHSLLQLKLKYLIGFIFAFFVRKQKIADEKTLKKIRKQIYRRIWARIRNLSKK